MKMFNAPVAGANYAADTKNYAWHRPPDIVNYDEAVDYLINKLKEPEQLELVFSLLKIDTQISTVVSSILMQSISRGKFSIDLGILIAGPLARYISIIADEQDIKYDMGVSDKDRISITPTTLKMALGFIDNDKESPSLEQPVETPLVSPESGLMGAPIENGEASMDEQAKMLGMIEEEEPENGLA